MLISIPEFHKGIMYPYTIEMNETITLFNKQINLLAKNHNLRVLNLNHTEKDFFDGVHLNRTGIENFAKQITSFILKDKGI